MHDAAAIDDLQPLPPEEQEVVPAPELPPDDGGTAALDANSPAPEVSGPGAPKNDPDTAVLDGNSEKSESGQSLEKNVVARTAAGQAVRSAGLIPGASLGVAAGLMAPPPLWPISVPVGAAIGLGTAFWAGDLAAKELERRGLALDPAKVPKEQQGEAVFGSVVGGGLAMTGQISALASTGARLAPTAVGNVLNRILDTAARRPVWQARTEVTSTVSAAAAEAAYENLRPGHKWERAGVGLVAGVVNPVDAMTTRLATATWSAGKWAWGTLGTAAIDYVSPRVPEAGLARSAVNFARELVPNKNLDRAAAALKQLFAASNENPRTFQTMLAKAKDIFPDVPGLEPATAAALTGSPRMAELEKNLMQQDQAFAGDRANALRLANEAVTNAIELLTATGNPQALQAAAKLRYERYSAMLQRLESYATKEAADTADDIAKGLRQGDRAELSRTAYSTFEGALDKARAVGAELAQKVFPLKSQPGSFDAVFDMTSTLRKEMGTLPAEVENRLLEIASARKVLAQVATGTTEAGVQITEPMIENARKLASVEQLLLLRSKFLSLARGAARATDEGAAGRTRHYGLMAEAALNDLIVSGAATTTAEAGRRGAGGKFARSTAYDDFREYERALHDVFTRTFGGVVGEKGAHGYKLPPEALMKTAFGSGDEVGALRFQELLDGVRFLPKRGIEDTKMLAAAENDVVLALDAQQKWLRLIADRARNPNTGEVNTERLGEFLRNSDELMQRFPEVAADLKAALAAKTRLDEWAERIAGIRKNMDSDRGLFGRLIKVESAPRAIQSALGGPRPIAELDSMLATARTSGPDAVLGFRSAVWRAVFEGAGTAGARANDPAAFLKKVIFNFEHPVQPGLPSLAQYFVSKQLMSGKEKALLARLKDAASNLETAFATKATGEETVPHIGAFERLLTAAGGSFAARHALEAALNVFGLKQNVGQSLIVAQKGSSATSEAVSRLPRLAAQQLLADAFSGRPLRPGGASYSLLDLILEKAATPEAQVQQAYRLHAYAWASGLLASQEGLSAHPLPETARGEEPLAAPEPAGLMERARNLFSR